MDIKANVTYTVYGVTVKLPKRATLDEQRAALLAEADLIMESIDVETTISDCNIEELNG